MLKCKIKYSGRGAGIRVKAEGTAKELMVEIGALIATVYQNINKSNPEAAEGFKHALIGTLLDPESPVWKEKNDEM